MSRRGHGPRNASCYLRLARDDDGPARSPMGILSPSNATFGTLAEHPCFPQRESSIILPEMLPKLPLSLVDQNSTFQHRSLSLSICHPLASQLALFHFSNTFFPQSMYPNKLQTSKNLTLYILPSRCLHTRPPSPLQLSAAIKSCFG